MLDPDGRSYLEKDGMRVPLALVRNSFYVQGRLVHGDVCPAEAVGPEEVSSDAGPAPAHPAGREGGGEAPAVEGIGVEVPPASAGDAP